MKQFFIFLLLGIIAAGIGAGIGVYMAVMDGLPQIEELKRYQPAAGTRVYALDDRFVAEFSEDKGIHVSLSSVPKHFVDALVATEDQSFWTHKGIDLTAIARALIKDAAAGRMKEGGSTLTQQLAKVLFLNPEKRLKRKLQEMVMAFQMEKTLSKEEILELYINRVYFGHGAYGLEMAARTYFGKSVQDLTLPESALIAGLVKAPSRYSPYANLQMAQERQRIVLGRMVDEKMLARKDADEAAGTPLVLKNTALRQQSTSYFLEALRKKLEDAYGTDAVYRGGLQAYTTMDLSMQSEAENALRWGLRRSDKLLGWRGPIGKEDVESARSALARKGKAYRDVRPGELVSGVVLDVGTESARVSVNGRVGVLPKKNAEWAVVTYVGPGKTRRWSEIKLQRLLSPGAIVYVSMENPKQDPPVLHLEQNPKVEGAIVAIEPSTGFVKAIVGGYDYSQSEFNRATTAQRQPGSAFKPFIYAAAMDAGLTPADMIVDEPIEYNNPDGSVWKPGNYGGKNYGPTRLREALTYSRNVVTVKLLEHIGLQKALETAQQFGFKGNLPQNLTLALGSLTVTPLELTSIYTAFANGGSRVKPTLVRYVTDSKGNLLENHSPEFVQAVTPETGFLVTSMMEDVIKFGTGKHALQLEKPAAGKTGTTNDHRDTWFIGFTPDLVTGVWVGYDDMTPMGKPATGGGFAVPIWTRYMKNVLLGKEARGFMPPPGVVTARIDPDTGLLAGDDTPAPLSEYFKDGTAPTAYTTKELRDVMVRRRVPVDEEAHTQD